MVTFDMILTFGLCIDREYSLKVLIDTQSFFEHEWTNDTISSGSGATPLAGTHSRHTWNMVCPHQPQPLRELLLGSHLFPRIPGNKPV